MRINLFFLYTLILPMYIMNIIEKEILRSYCYYNFYDYVKDKFIDSFNIDNDNSPFKIHYNFYPKVREILIRWLFILVMIRTEEDDPVFVAKKSADLETQIIKDMHMLFAPNNPKKIKIHEFSVDLAEDIFKLFTSYNTLINTTKVNEDSKVIIEGTTLTYYSDSIGLYKMSDPYVAYNNRIKVIKLLYHSDVKYLDASKYTINNVFAAYFRYKYMYADNQTLAYDYSTSVKSSAVECFSTAFNHHHDYFCTAYPDVEAELGSLGSYFYIINAAINKKFKFPSNILYINPPFDEILDKRIVELAIAFLDSTEDKYKMSFILPNWKNFKAVDLLLASKYHTKHDIFEKGKLSFNNYFTNRKIFPCEIIIAYLEN